MSNYFRRVPNFEYVNRLPDAKIGDYNIVKNFFKRGKLREDIFQELAFFTKYQIEGDDRPDNVAFKVYNDSRLDWLVLVSNNVVNIQTEWPLSQNNFDAYLLDKYGTYENLNSIHHYETTEIKNGDNVVVVPAGLRVPSNYTVEYFDGTNIISASPVVEVTNLQYENKIQEERRNIWVLKPRYLNIVRDDMEEIMTYKKGSSQFKTESLKRGDNIRLFQ